MEDQRDGVFQHAKGQSGEEQQAAHADPADHLAIGQQLAHRVQQNVFLARPQMLDLNGDDAHQARFIHQVRQQHAEQGEQRHAGQQDVVADATGQQHATVGDELSDDAQGEGQQARQKAQQAAAHGVCSRVWHGWASSLWFVKSVQG